MDGLYVQTSKPGALPDGVGEYTFAQKGTMKKLEFGGAFSSLQQIEITSDSKEVEMEAVEAGLRDCLSEFAQFAKISF